MSLTPREYRTPIERAARVLSAHGRAPVTLGGMDDSEIAALAALCDVRGVLVCGARNAVRDVLRGYYERQKAVVDEQEWPIDSIQ